ncbi:MAG: hypothetical protein CMN32_04130 [Saprospirales bacterium]|jgi:hypothetical protein|nr:hypothetical protein [Saprospirales bacterium]
MKRSLHLSLAILAVAFMLFSCTKEQDLPVITSQNSPDQAYMMSLKNRVVFVVQQKDLATGQVSGWFIDKYGKVRSFEGVAGLDGELTKASQVEALVQASVSVPLSLAPEELAPKARLIKALSNQHLTEAVIDPDAGVDYRVMAILANDYNQHPNSCSERPGADNWDEELANSYQLLLLKAEGSINQVNQSDKAAILLDWLYQIQQSGGL